MDATSEDEKSADAARKSMKMTNSFIRKQSSTKIIQKIKSHRSIDPRGPHDITSPPTTTTAPTTQSTTSKRTLQAITEILNKDGSINNKPDPQPEQPKTVAPSNQQTPNNRSRRSVKCNNDEISKAPPSLSKSFAQPSTTWNGSVSRGTSSKYIEINNENQAPSDTGAIKEDGPSPLTSDRSNNSKTIPDVVQKMSDLEKVIFGRDKVYEMEQVELKKQLDEMRNTVVTLVTALSALTQKIV